MSTGLILPFLVETGLVTYRTVATSPGIQTGPSGNAPIKAPLPSLYTSVIIVYGGLALMPKSVGPIPQLIGWGFVIATFLNLYAPGSANAAAAANAKAAQALTTTAPGITAKPTTVRSTP